MNGGGPAASADMTGVATKQERLLIDAFERLAARPYAGGTLEALEAVLDALYAECVGEGVDALRRLEERLSDYEGRLTVIDVWLALTRLCLSNAEARGASSGALNGALAGAPPYTRLLAAAESARIVWESEGPTRAWRWLASLGADAALGGLPPPGDVRTDSSLLVHAVCLYLELSALNGDWQAHQVMAGAVASLWLAGHPSAVRVGLALVEGTLLRGGYLDALRMLASFDPQARGELRARALYLKLRSQVAAGRDDDSTQRTFEALVEAWDAPPVPGHELPAGDREALRAGVMALIASSAALRDLAKGTDFQAPINRAAEGSAAEGSAAEGSAAEGSAAEGSAAEGSAAEGLPHLLRLEAKARRIKNAEKRTEALFKVWRGTTELLQRADAAATTEGWIRLRLLWCRVVVDLALDEVFEQCESALGWVIDDADRLGFVPLAMAARDQRAVLRSKKSPADWKGALLDASAAVRIAIEQIVKNVATGGPDEGLERALLESLLPVLDRVIDLHAEGAMRVASRHPELLEEPIGAIDDRILEEDSPRGTWLRFGRVLQCYAEQTQALALEEARRAYQSGRTVPSRFALRLEGVSPVVVNSLRGELPPGDAILQYFVVGRYVLVFAYGRDFFDWSVGTTDGIGGAERALEGLIHGLRPWTQGAKALAPAESLCELQALLTPPKIAGALTQAGVRHVRVVPHSVLYRVPFGRLQLGSVPFLHRFSLSLHPTGALAARSAERGRLELRRRPKLGYVFGPERKRAATSSAPASAPSAVGETGAVSCAEHEGRALRLGLGTLRPLASIEKIDGVASSLRELVARLGDYALLHFTCHGREGSELDGRPGMMLGREPDADLEPDAIVNVDLTGCALVVLQSCSTGWMDHRRADPVQGLPQAFCDAGAGAVIAPLTKVPQALVPIFSEVLYRALRFLPAEKALQRALSVVRAHGSVLVLASPDARAAFVEHGSTMDSFEYRYTGATGLTLGGPISRWLGRASFWWFERQLRRVGARQAKRPALGPSAVAACLDLAGRRAGCGGVGLLVKEGRGND